MSTFATALILTNLDWPRFGVFWEVDGPCDESMYAPLIATISHQPSRCDRRMTAAVACIHVLPAKSKKQIRQLSGIKKTKSGRPKITTEYARNNPENSMKISDWTLIPAPITTKRSKLQPAYESPKDSRDYSASEKSTDESIVGHCRSNQSQNMQHTEKPRKIITPNERRWSPCNKISLSTS